MARLPIHLRGDSLSDYMDNTPEEWAIVHRHLAECAAARHQKYLERQAAGRQKAKETYRRNRAVKLAQPPFQKFSDGMSGLVDSWLPDH